MRKLSVLMMVLVCWGGMAMAQENRPMKEAEKAEWHLSSLIVKNVRPVTYLHASTQATIREMDKALKTIFEPMMQELHQGTFRMDGPVVFVYHDCDGSPDKPFQLTTGAIVAKDAKPMQGYQIKELAGGKMATAYYTGPVKHMGKAAGKVYEMMMSKNLDPTGEYREVYLFWEGPESANNVVEIQFVLHGDGVDE